MRDSNRRSFWPECLAAALAAAALFGGPASAQQAGRSRPVQARARSDPRGPLVSVGAGVGGRCEIRWQETPVTDSELLTHGVDFIEEVIRKVGGIANVTAENFPAVNLRVSEDAPYRCVRSAIQTLATSGIVELRIDNPRPGAPAWANPFVFLLDLEAAPKADEDDEPIYNRVKLSGSWMLSWNGDRIDFVTLGQYCDLTQTMVPTPMVVLDFDGQAPFGDVRPVLGIVWRAHVERIALSPLDEADGGGGDPIHLEATTISRPGSGT